MQQITSGTTTKEFKISGDITSTLENYDGVRVYSDYTASGVTTISSGTSNAIQYYDIKITNTITTRGYQYLLLTENSDIQNLIVTSQSNFYISGSTIISKTVGSTFITYRVTGVTGLVNGISQNTNINIKNRYDSSYVFIEDFIYKGTQRYNAPYTYITVDRNLNFENGKLYYIDYVFKINNFQFNGGTFKGATFSGIWNSGNWEGSTWKGFNSSTNNLTEPTSSKPQYYTPNPLNDIPTISNLNKNK